MPRGNRAVPAWPHPEDDAAEPTQGWTRPALGGRQRLMSRRQGWNPLAMALSAAVGIVVGVGVAVGILLFAGAQPTALPPATGAGSISVTVDDAFLTAAMGDALHQVALGVNVHDVAAHCVPGDQIQLRGVADAQLGPFTQPMPLAISLQPAASQGHLTVHVLSARIGGLTLPGAVDAQIEAAANSQLGSVGHVAVAGAPPYEVRAIQTTYQHLTILLGPAAG